MAADGDIGAVLAPFDVSRETREKLELFVGELARWQVAKNLVASSTLNAVWLRHIADSLQLMALEPTATRWIDLGSGAGFPGLVIAIAGAPQGVVVDLVESNAGKCAFLRHVARLVHVTVKVHAKRLETAVPTLIGRADIVTARALAPLTQLLAWTEPLLTTGCIGLFPKGRNAADELTTARESWRFNADLLPSQTDSEASIIRITSLARAAP